MSHPRYALTIVLVLLVHTVTPAQQAAIALDKNDPELRAILTEIETDAEQARIKAKIPGMSIGSFTVTMFCWPKALATPISRKRSPPIPKRSIG